MIYCNLSSISLVISRQKTCGFILYICLYIFYYYWQHHYYFISVSLCFFLLDLICFLDYFMPYVFKNFSHDFRNSLQSAKCTLEGSIYSPISLSSQISNDFNYLILSFKFMFKLCILPTADCGLQIILYSLSMPAGAERKGRKQMDTPKPAWCFQSSQGNGH